MVIVKNYHLREGDNGNFYSLELIGEPELIQSQNTGRFYATVRRCFISSTFDELTARMMVGKQMKGNIVRVKCEPYEYTLPETGEVITIVHRYDYTPESTNVLPQVSSMPFAFQTA